MKINKLCFPVFCLVFVLGISARAQEKTNLQNNLGEGGGSCSCSDPTARCTASVTCPSGNAVCICSDTGCTSYCSGGGGGENPEGRVLLSKLQTTEISEIGDVLGKAFGKTVTFTPFKKDKFSFDYNADDSVNYWDILEYLAQNGELKINRGDYQMWKKIRQIATSQKVSFCTGNASLGSLVGELSFFAGKKYKIVGGNPASKINIDIKGLNLDGIVEALQRHYQIIIQR